MTMTTNRATIKVTYRDGKEIIQTRDVEHRFYGLTSKNRQATRNKLTQLEKDLKKFNKDIVKFEILEVSLY